MTEMDDDSAEWPDPEDRAHAIEQARRLRDQVGKGGLRFEAYLPPTLALWLIDRVEQGKFLDPSEAIFVLLGEAHQMEPHTDLREELLKRSIKAVMDDASSNVPVEVIMDELREMLTQPHDEPARWETRSRR